MGISKVRKVKYSLKSRYNMTEKHRVFTSGLFFVTRDKQTTKRTQVMTFSVTISVLIQLNCLINQLHNTALVFTNKLR